MIGIYILAGIVLFATILATIGIFFAKRAPRFDDEVTDYMPDEPAISNLSLSDRIALREKNGVEHE